jgi:lipopolysaccharide/colanic/teichoic acid biosynthesis glycosyltransferase
MTGLQRAFDVAVASAALAMTAIPLGVAALVIKLSSDGPVLYRQVRIGRGGRPFEFYKLRTMTMTVADGPQVTATGDTRVTAIGQLLRRLKVDELPQLWNVLSGDMAIIGPRPEVPRFVARYTHAQRAILAAQPGLASAAQLAFAGEADMLRDVPDAEDAYVRYLMPAKIQLDLEYERTRTFGSDCRLMVEITLLIFGKRSRTLPFPIPTVGDHR